jgi:retron-type reverse transcriptase
MSLLALGVLQPASAAEIRVFLSTVFRDGGTLPSVSDFENFLDEQAKDRRVLIVYRNTPRLYSLTLHGNHYLPLSIRKLRDKLRMYLLRDAHRRRFFGSRGETDEGLAGDSPAVDTSSALQGTAANKFGRGRIYWPRILGQFVDQTGLTRSPRDTFPPFLSFLTGEQAAQAAGLASHEFTLDYVGVALCLGVSTKLISQIAHNSERHYRHFKLPKKGGGERLIESPRVFLRVVQWFLADFIFNDLRTHPSIHSFSRGRSIVTNAQLHVGRSFVANIDIKEFFGNITSELLSECLRRHGFERVAADLLTRLCTNANHLPQGAPTSPMLSNSILYRFDAQMERFCDGHSLRYSRYADDITISGEDRAQIIRAIGIAASALKNLYNLQLREDKTRIASRNGQQRVTGVVVNHYAVPSRIFRRRVRALFHKASLQPAKYLEQVPDLVGYLGFLKSFPALREGRETMAYEEILHNLQSIKRHIAQRQGPAARRT